MIFRIDAEGINFFRRKHRFYEVTLQVPSLQIPDRHRRCSLPVMPSADCLVPVFAFVKVRDNLEKQCLEGESGGIKGKILA